MFSNEIYEEPKISSPVSVPLSNCQSSDDGMLKSLFEQNTKIIDKLETLFNKQELLSSNQFQLFETVSALSKKIDDVLIMPNDCYLDALSTNDRSVSPHNVSQVTNTNANIRSAAAVPAQPLIGSNFYPIPNNVQTNFPIHPFGHSTFGATAVTTASSSFVNPYLPVTPQIPFAATSPLTYSMEPASKESYVTTNRSIASSCVSSSVNTTPSVPGSAQVPAALSQPINFGELFDQNRSQTFADYCNVFQDAFANSPAKINDFLPPAAPSTPSSSLFPPPSKISFFQQVTTPPATMFGSTGVSTAPHSFQISNMVGSMVLQPSVQVPEDDEESDDGDGRTAVEHDPMPNFKPIIPLPDEVVVKTGEEEEEVLFESRAKLYRFADKEWKERGIGPLKILKNKTSGRVRVLMRREVVHKICANHFLSEEMDLKTMPKSDRAWVYSAPDFSDETVVVEKFCVKFASPEIANTFFNVFNEYKRTPAATDKSPAAKKSTPVASPVLKPSTPTSMSSPVFDRLDEKQKKTVIAPPVLNVSAAKKATSTPESSKTQLGGFTFSAKPILTSALERKDSPTGVPANAKPSAGSTAAVDDKRKQPFAAFAGFSLDSLSHSSGESNLFSSMAAAASTTSMPPPPVTKKEEKGGGLFAVVDNALDFSSLSKNADNAAFAKSKDFKGFAGAGAPVFGSKFALTKSAAPNLSPLAATSNSTPQKSAAVASAATTSDSKSTDSPQESANDSEYEPTAEFTPVIPLPDLVDVKTGEEGLDVLYEEHCKLFRYTDEQWKERGVGKMKILRDPKDGGVRLLMRRDQVHKLCCNQRLTANHELQSLKTTEKAWSWIGQDFSEGELKSELLCVRFKTVEMATAFKEAFNKAKAQLPGTPAASQNASPASNKAAPSTLPSLSEMFKRDRTMWECKVCYVSNKEHETACVACMQPRDGVAKPEPSIFGSSGGGSGGSFTFSANPTSTSTPSLFGNVGTAPTTSTSSAVTASSSTPFSFGVPPTTTAPPAPVFSFGMPPTFASVASSAGAGAGSVAATTASSSQDGVGAAVAATAPVFSFGSQPASKSESGGLMFGNTGSVFGDKSAMSSSSSSSPKRADDNASTVELTTTASKSEATPTSSLFGGTGKSSFSQSAENSGAFSNFSFKLPGLGGTNESKIAPFENKLATPVIESSSSDEVEFVSETNVSEEDQQLAKSLMLPPNYFAYKYIKDCPGCVGCDDEDRKNAEKAAPKIGLVPETSLKSANSPSIFQTTVDIKNAPTLASTEKPGFTFGSAADNSASSTWLNKSSFNFSNVFNLNRGNVPADSTPEKVHSSKKADDDEESDDDKDASVVPNDQDPYFEPVIALPNLVETKTGEEDETIEFCERSKLFRFDAEKKEWKERGVGDLKVLFHPVKKTYRLLLRREQVHKVVLNQRITTALNIQPLSSSTNSWCWFGMNLPEEHSEPVLEKLAARFKTEEISKKFEQVVLKCIAQLSGENDASASSEVIVVSSEKDVSRANDLSNVSEEYAEDDENNYDGSYEQEYYYVDEDAIEDAMADVGDNSVIVFDSFVTLRIFEGESSADYEGLVRLVKGSPDAPEHEDSKSYIDFSTKDIPSLYYAEITERSQVLLEENDAVTILEDDPAETERKITFHFPDKELCQDFFEIYQTIK